MNYTQAIDIATIGNPGLEKRIAELAATGSREAFLELALLALAAASVQSDEDSDIIDEIDAAAHHVESLVEP